MRKLFELADKEINSLSLVLEGSELQLSKLQQLNQLQRGSRVATEFLLQTRRRHLKEALLTALQQSELSSGQSALLQFATYGLYKYLQS